MSGVKAPSSTGELPLKLLGLRTGGGSGTLHVTVKCVDMQRKAGGEGDFLDGS
jgi:hypothetical protein